MKVLHIISGGDSGGAKTHVFALLDSLKNYLDVKMICLSPGVFYKEIIKKDIPTVLVEQKNRFDLSVVKRIVDIIKSEQYNIVHVHGARANFIATFLKRKINIPIVTTVHSDYKIDFTDSLYKRIVFTALNSFSLRCVDYYIGVSKSFKRMLIERSYNPNKIFTVYNGMDFNMPVSYIGKEEFAEKYNITFNDKLTYVGIIGRFDKVKGHDVFIKGAAEVLKNNPDVRFLLAGEGPEQKKLQAIARELNISDKVYFLGYVSDIFSFINFIDINSLTSYSESFPYVLLEGAKLKKATISSEVGGISDLIENSVNGYLFKSGDYQDFAKKLLKLINNKELIKKLGESLYIKASSKFSGENLAKSHVEIYESILADYYNKYKYDIVMSGYYGFNNSGDDALLKAIISNLKSFNKNLRILTLSAKPKQTKSDFEVDSANRFNPFAIHKVLKKSRLFLNGGGTLIHDSTSSKSLWYYLTLIRWAKRAGLKVVIYANGYGPFKKQNEKFAANVTELADLITLRDDLSYKELRRIGVMNENVHITADPAITLIPSDEAEINKILKSENIDPNEKYIAVSVRCWPKNDKDIEIKMAKILDYVYKRYKIKTIFIPMKLNEDLSISKNILKNMKAEGIILKEEYSAEDLMAIISKCELMLGMRLHSLIYSTTVAVPVIGLVYDPKIKGFLKYINQNETFDISDLNIKLIKNSIDNVLSDKESISDKLKAHVEILKEKAILNAKLTVDLLNNE